VGRTTLPVSCCSKEAGRIGDSRHGLLVSTFDYAERNMSEPTVDHSNASQDGKTSRISLDRLAKGISAALNLPEIPRDRVPSSDDEISLPEQHHCASHMIAPQDGAAN
jgi:hypothetical protein